MRKVSRIQPGNFKARLGVFDPTFDVTVGPRGSSRVPRQSDLLPPVNTVPLFDKDLGEVRVKEIKALAFDFDLLPHTKSKPMGMVKLVLPSGAEHRPIVTGQDGSPDIRLKIVALVDLLLPVDFPLPHRA